MKSAPSIAICALVLLGLGVALPASAQQKLDRSVLPIPQVELKQ